MSDSRLEGMSPERLTECAKFLRGLIGYLSVHHYGGEHLAKVSDAADTLDAVAGAERGMIPARGTPGGWGFFADDPFIIRYPREINFAATKTHPTLAAALGSVPSEIAAYHKSLDGVATERGSGKDVETVRASNTGTPEPHTGAGGSVPALPSTQSLASVHSGRSE